MIRWRVAVGLGVVIPALLLGGGSRAGERSGVERSEVFLTLRVRAPFDEVLADVQAAVARRNWAMASINNLDDTLRGRAADRGRTFDFDHYKIVSFCNLTLADEVLRTEPYVGAFMPCRLAMFVRKGSGEVVLVTVRPTFLARLFPSPEIRRLAELVEGDILAILEMVAGK